MGTRATRFDDTRENGEHSHGFDTRAPDVRDVVGAMGNRSFANLVAARQAAGPERTASREPAAAERRPAQQRNGMPATLAQKMVPVAALWIRNPRIDDVERVEAAIAAAVDLEPDFAAWSPEHRSAISTNLLASLLRAFPPRRVDDLMVTAQRYPAKTLALTADHSDLTSLKNVRPLLRREDVKRLVEQATRLSGHQPKAPPRFLGELEQSVGHLTDYLGAASRAVAMIDPTLLRVLEESALRDLPALRALVAGIQTIPEKRPRRQAHAAASSQFVLWMTKAEERSATAHAALVAMLIGEPGLEDGTKERIDAGLARNVIAVEKLTDGIRRVYRDVPQVAVI